MAAHVKQLDKLLATLQENGITLKLPKCSFGVPEINVFGDIVSGRHELKPETPKRNHRNGRNQERMPKRNHQNERYDRNDATVTTQTTETRKNAPSNDQKPVFPQCLVSNPVTFR